MIRRLVLPGAALSGDRLVLPTEASRYVAQVLRLGPGAELLLLDGAGLEVTAEVEAASPQGVTVRLTGRRELARTATPALHLIQALPKGGKLDEIVRRATELGVASIRPCLSERSIARPDQARAADRQERWRRIAAEAARQCRRSRVPEVRELVPLAEALRAAPAQALRLLLWEGEEKVGLGARLARRGAEQELALVIGPEGGFSAAEAALAAELGYLPASLGPLVLRLETAAVAACAVAQFALGAFDPA